MILQRVFVDRDRIDCQGRCEPKVQGQLEVFCLYCHHDVIVQTSCLHVIQDWSGKDRRRCRRYDLNEHGYCRAHADEWKPQVRIRHLADSARRGLGSVFKLYGEQVIDETLTEIAQGVARNISLPATQLLDVLDKYTANAERVYFMRSGGYVKIGRSLYPEQRLANLKKYKGQTVIPDCVDMNAAELVATLPGGRRVESEMHLRFSKYRVAGEWFKWSKDVREFVESLNSGGEMSVKDFAKAVQAEMKL